MVDIPGFVRKYVKERGEELKNILRGKAAYLAPYLELSDMKLTQGDVELRDVSLNGDTIWFKFAYKGSGKIEEIVEKVLGVKPEIRVTPGYSDKVFGEGVVVRNLINGGKLLIVKEEHLGILNNISQLYR